MLDLCFVTPTTTLSGNVTTSNRISCLLTELGHNVEMFSPSSVETAFGKSYDCCFYLHSLRCGSLVWKKDGTPRIFAKRFVLILGGTDANESHNENDEAVMLHVAKHSDRVVCFSDAMVSAALAKWGDVLSADKVVVIPQSVCPCAEPSTATMSQYVQGTGPVVLLPSGLRPVKGIDFALDAWRTVNQAIKAVTLMIVGPPLVEETHQSVVSEQQRNPTVVYVEGISRCDLIELMKDERTLCVLNTSRSEGQPQALLEAMQVEKLCVARAIPGNLAVINDDNGILVNSPAELSEVIERLALRDSEASVRKLAAAGKEYVCDAHSQQRERERYAALLDAL